MITISLCMIVKNEAAVLERILKPMSAIADQIVIVDTGSADETKEIARRYTDDVYEMDWRDDFSAARNLACSYARMDYWMWLDADDVIDEENAARLLDLKHSLPPSADVVMMRYLTGFDQDGNCTFSYYRERLLKTSRGFCWKGRVHEAVTPSGNILYSPIEIRHEKLGPGDPDRNLRIYETMLREGEALSPRELFYYGRELYFHKHFSEAAAVFSLFLEDPDGWRENKIDACLLLSRCHEQLGRRETAMADLTKSFVYSCPRGEVCCALGELMLGAGRLAEAVYWYEQALSSVPDETTGAFVQKDCYRFIPLIQLCVCWDRMGDKKKAFYYHRLSRALKPQDSSVKANEAYFSGLKAEDSASAGASAESMFEDQTSRL